VKRGFVRPAEFGKIFQHQRPMRRVERADVIRPPFCEKLLRVF